MTGTLFHIQRFSLHDGPGIRTTFFLMGCPMKCLWCHNPEGMDGKIRLQFSARDCIGCGICQKLCPVNAHTVSESGHEIRFQDCMLCGQCITACPAGALQYSGWKCTSDALAKEGLRDLPFYAEDGGITFSGGEPLLQADFVAETAALCKSGSVPSVAVETAGAVPWSAFEQVIPWTDYFLFDIKAGSETVYRTATGGDIRRILENLRRLNECAGNIEVRVPVIPGVNDTVEEMESIAELLSRMRNIRKIRLLPYHTFGREKYQMLGLPCPPLFPPVDPEKTERFRRILEKGSGEKDLIPEPEKR